MTAHHAQAERAGQPRSEPGVPGASTSADSVPLQASVLEEVIRALANALASRNPEPPPPAGRAVSKPLLDLDETAELLGVSRMTIARMADEGRLPSVVVRRGKVQKTRRIPRAFIDKMVADAAAGAQVDLEEYAAAWLAATSRVRRLPPTSRNEEPQS